MNYVLEGRLLIGLNGKEIVLNTATASISIRACRTG